MAKYSDWRTDLREVMDDDTDNKKVTGKGVNNNKLIKINPKLGEAVEEIGGQILEMKEVDDANKDETIEKDADAEKKAAMADKVKKKEAMLKKRIVRMKMMAVNQGAADSIVAGYEPEGELIEGKDGLWDNIRQKKARMKAGSGEKKAKPGDKDYPKTLNVEGLEKARKNVGASTCWDGYKAKGTKKKGGKEVPNCVKEASAVLDANTAIRNVERKKKLEYLKKLSKAVRRKDYHPFLHDPKESVEHVDEGVMKFIKDRVGGKKKPEKKAEMDKTTEKLHDLRKDKFKTDKQKEHEKYVNFLPVDEEVVTERLGGKGYQPYTDLRGKKISGDWEDSDRGAGNKAKKRAGRKVEKKSPTYMAHVLNKEEVELDELNRFGKETGKATGSINKRPGSPVAKRNEPASPVNTVRRMIRKDTGRPEGQQKKVKGVKGLSQPGDRRFTPAQTISRMRAQVAAADAAMRDTRGT